MIERLDDELLRSLEASFRKVARRAGARLACKPGCSECCHGPFPITRLDALRLRRGLEALRDRDPRRARAIVRRAARAVERLRPGFPGDGATGRLESDEATLDTYFASHASLTCPVLDPSSGCCELYESRPVCCRNYGPPQRFEGVDSPACRLCFRGADRETVERCRMTPDPRGLEQTILARMGVPPGAEWESLIAFVVSYL